jgi:hypothetical protein
LASKHVNNSWFSRLCHSNMLAPTILTDLPSKYVKNSYTRLCHQNMLVTCVCRFCFAKMCIKSCSRLCHPKILAKIIPGSDIKMCSSASVPDFDHVNQQLIKAQNIHPHISITNW